MLPGRHCVTRLPFPAMQSGPQILNVPIQLAHWKRPIKHACNTLFPFALDVCRHHLSRSIAEQQTSSHTTWQRRPSPAVQAQVCGDAHISNFGAFATPERKLVFDVNDFDETLEGTWEWDVKRLAASIVLAARQNGYTAQKSGKAVLSCLQYYREHMYQFAMIRKPPGPLVLPPGRRKH